MGDDSGCFECFESVNDDMKLLGLQLEWALPIGQCSGICGRLEVLHIRQTSNPISKHGRNGCFQNK